MTGPLDILKSHIGLLIWSAILLVILFRLIKSHLSHKKLRWIIQQPSKLLDKPTTTEKLPYQKKWYLLSKAERSFYEILQQTVGDKLHVFPKVRLLDLLWLPERAEQRQLYMNKVQSKHVDFVLCDKKQVAPVLVIELDDSSHQLFERKIRDAFVNEALHAAGLPILRVPVKSSYLHQELAGLIEKEIGKSSDLTNF